MSITGLGLIGLPLSDYDAKRMISAATLAPFGHGERTVIDKTVRDTWEIDPEKITFVNPAWNEHIDKAICTEVCTALGVSASVSKMELYKLLLYETGSQYVIARWLLIVLDRVAHLAWTAFYHIKSRLSLLDSIYKVIDP